MSKINYPLLYLFIIIQFMVLISCNTIAPPKPLGPVPTKRQLAWQDMQYYAFVHFNMNTFTDMEWGTGGESPELFNPSQLDCRQWARIAKEAGMKGIILTAKHHDGFCLWPTKTTAHSVKNSPWKNGKGDVVRELREACDAYGLKMGLYLSPWDRNNAEYGTDAYVDLYHEQLLELVTNYGELFEVWFDGANGGSGYYGGANETRKIDNKTYYKWNEITEIIRKHQPNAVIFSDSGPDIRWVGNEEGWANETNWSIMRRDEMHPGWPRYVESRSGHEDGTHWLPAEVNTSIRPGWYYHPGEDHQVKSLPRLVQTYYESIGRNGTFLLNIPVDDRGLVHETDSLQLMALKHQIDKDFALELAKGHETSASNIRGNNSTYNSEKAIDNNPETYWATDDQITEASITVKFDQPTLINRVLLQEYIPLGQRVQKFSVVAEVNGAWKTLDEQTTIGYKRILQFDDVEATQVQVNISKAKGAITLSNLELYHAPKLLVEPKITRNHEGMVSLTVPDTNVDMYYTLDGTVPTIASTKYLDPFLVDSPTTVKAISVDALNRQQTEVGTTYFDISSKDWQLISGPAKTLKDAEKLMDGNPYTYWSGDKEYKGPQEIVIDLGQSYWVNGFTYWPNQDRYYFGLIKEYSFYTSTDGKQWQLANKGEFSNIKNNRIEQTINFQPQRARYIKLRADELIGEDVRASFAEVGILTH
ncbi:MULTISPECIES: alpha-L-fucosidase [Flavobacteriaceae]|uniref:alpha-L-fucosidase n=1 Tax=Flavobacteriaceae TaxID=49546 RepID=UPI001491EF51|nr:MULTISPECIES: alpha-L-fucosidase [Allomuricauda]MDC6366913.1 alpha-L-fucosidase [Muricauda sp. AC10]